MGGNLQWLQWALLASVLWGVAPILAKLGLQSLRAETAIFLRSAVICVVSGVWLAASGKLAEVTHIGLRPGLAIAAEGMAASLIGHFAYYRALQLGAAGSAVPVSSAFPLVTLIASAVIFHEALSVKKILGALLIVAGVVILKSS